MSRGGVLIDTGCNCGAKLEDIKVTVEPPKWDCPDNPVTCQRATCDECVVLAKALAEANSPSTTPESKR